MLDRAKRMRPAVEEHVDRYLYWHIYASTSGNVDDAVGRRTSWTVDPILVREVRRAR